MQLYARIYLLLNYCTCFGHPSCPSSGVHETVVATSSTYHILKYAVLIWSHLKKLTSQTVWSVPEAATTVLCTPDDGRDGHTKHVG